MKRTTGVEWGIASPGGERKSRQYQGEKREPKRRQEDFYSAVPIQAAWVGGRRRHKPAANQFNFNLDSGEVPGRGVVQELAAFLGLVGADALKERGTRQLDAESEGLICHAFCLNPGGITVQGNVAVEQTPWG
jgi:hypothetical protein